MSKCLLGNDMKIVRTIWSNAKTKLPNHLGWGDQLAQKKVLRWALLETKLEYEDIPIANVVCPLEE